jgi:hypothetical protein
MIKIKQSSGKYQAMAISSTGSCEFMNWLVAAKLVVTLIFRRTPFVLLSSDDSVVFSSALKLCHLKR